MMVLDNPTQKPWQWTGYSFRAMNTTVQTWLYSQMDNMALLDVQRLFNSFEKRLSRFDPQSELSRLNAAEGVFQASPILLDTLEAALLAAEATGGLYDPTTLPALERAGYDRSFEQLDQPASFVPVSGSRGGTANPGRTAQRAYAYRSITFNRAKREIYKPAGVRLDLGGMGKGWTVDRAADKLHGLGPFLVNAGGDIFAYHSPPGQKGWEIDLVHPLNPEAHFARLMLHHRALATSTIAKRRWQHQGHSMHHLIDPRTGQPAQTDALSVSVVADRTMTAEIYAKVALILGAEQGLAYLQSLPAIEGLIFTADSRLLFTSGLTSLLERLEPAGYLN